MSTPKDKRTGGAQSKNRERKGKLRISPPPEHGIHTWTISAARQARNQGANPEEAITAILSFESSNRRPYNPGEVEDAVRKVYDTQLPKIERASKWPELNADLWSGVVAEGGGVDALRRDSPRPLGEPELNTQLVLDVLFPGREDVLLCFGLHKRSAMTRSRSFWRRNLDKSRCLMVPSPMAGGRGKTKEGKWSARCSDNTGPREFLVVEFDEGTLDEQASILQHLSRFGRLTMVVFSGSKSLHGWFHVAGQSEPGIKRFMNYTVSLGADSAMWTRCQFARTPCARRENGALQEVYYLNPAALDPENAPTLLVPATEAWTEEVTMRCDAQSLREREGAIAPDTVFYEAGTGYYHVDVGTHYRCYSRKGPVLTGIKWYYLENSAIDEKDAGKKAMAAVSAIEVRSAVDWAGAIAGHRRGVLGHQKGKLLITSQADLVVPEAGQWSEINRIVDNLLGHTPPQKDVFFAWLKGAYLAVRDGVHQPAPLLAIAGPKNCGKSLLAWIVQKTLGGRIGHPHRAWSGEMIWNDDLVGAELLLIDDAVGSSDYRKRVAFATNFKEHIYAAEVQLRKRYGSSISVRPVWRVMACVNDTPDALEVLPPITPDMEDKLIFLEARTVEPPVDTSTPEGRKEYQSILINELPAFIHALLAMDVPKDLRDSRSGVIAYRHPSLVEAMQGETPAHQLGELLEIAFGRAVVQSGIVQETPEGRVWDGTSSELLAILKEPHSDTYAAANSLLRSARTAGKYLGELSKSPSGGVRVERASSRNGYGRWKITVPGPGESIPGG